LIRKAAQESVEKRDDGEREPWDVVLRIALESGKPTAGNRLDQHCSARDEDAEAQEQKP
jgi:hypothetical protein